MSSGREARPFRSFDDAEIMDDTRTAFNKIPIQEFGSEEFVVTDENILGRERAFYDQKSGMFVNETAIGICSCGRPLVRENFVKCYYGDMVCGRCVLTDFEGRFLCRTHLEFYVAVKEEAILLISYVLGLNASEARKVSGFSRSEVVGLERMLIKRGYLEIISTDVFFTRIKVNDQGRKIAKILAISYRLDPDFKEFLISMGLEKNVAGESQTQ